MCILNMSKATLLNTCLQVHLEKQCFSPFLNEFICTEPSKRSWQCIKKFWVFSVRVSAGFLSKTHLLMLTMKKLPSQEGQLNLPEWREKDLTECSCHSSEVLRRIIVYPMHKPTVVIITSGSTNKTSNIILLKILKNQNNKVLCLPSRQ